MCELGFVYSYHECQWYFKDNVKIFKVNVTVSAGTISVSEGTDQ